MHPARKLSTNLEAAWGEVSAWLHWCRINIFWGSHPWQIPPPIPHQNVIFIIHSRLTPKNVTGFNTCMSLLRDSLLWGVYSVRRVPSSNLSTNNLCICHPRGCPKHNVIRRKEKKMRIYNLRLWMSYSQVSLYFSTVKWYMGWPHMGCFLDYSCCSSSLRSNSGSKNSIRSKASQEERHITSREQPQHQTWGMQETRGRDGHIQPRHAINLGLAVAGTAEMSAHKAIRIAHLRPESHSAFRCAFAALWPPLAPGLLQL